MDEAAKENPLNFWLNSLKIENQLNSIPERIYTNWLNFEIPTKIYIHKPVIASNIDLVDIIYPYIEYSDRHICFFPKEDYPSSIEVANTCEFDVSNIIHEALVPVDDSLVFNLPRRKIVELINKTFSHHLIQQKLKKVDLSNSQLFYYPYNSVNAKRVSLKSIDKTNVSVTGRSKSNFWSFGVSHFAFLDPFPYIRINSHITFEDSEFNVLNDDDMHTMRRKYGFEWYNKDWLDTLQGFLIRLSDFDTGFKIRIPISASTVLNVNSIPINVESDFGYLEPEKKEKEDDE